MFAKNFSMCNFVLFVAKLLLAASGPTIPQCQAIELEYCCCCLHHYAQKWGSDIQVAVLYLYGVG